MTKVELLEQETVAPARGGTRMLRGLVLDIGLPIATYYGLRALGATDWVALLAATGVAGTRLVWGVVARREVNQFATMMLLVYGVGLVLSLVTGDPRILLLKGSLITGAIGATFLVTAIVGKRPLTLAAMQSFQPAQAAAFAEEYRTQPTVRGAYRHTSYVWGVGLLVESLLRIPLVYLLPIDIGFGVTEAMLVLTFVLLGGWTLAFQRRFDRV